MACLCGGLSESSSSHARGSVSQATWEHQGLQEVIFGVLVKTAHVAGMARHSVLTGSRKG